MSKAQLQAFITKANANPALKSRLDGAIDPKAVVALALEEGHVVRIELAAAAGALEALLVEAAATWRQ